jgi:hypothetical protein
VDLRALAMKLESLALAWRVAMILVSKLRRKAEGSAGKPCGKKMAL